MLRTVGRTLYHQLGDEPSDDDPILGLVDTPELAHRIVDALNDSHRARWSGVVDRISMTEPDRETDPMAWLEWRRDKARADDGRLAVAIGVNINSIRMNAICLRRLNGGQA